VTTKVNPLATVIAKGFGAAGVAALLSAGALSVSAAKPPPAHPVGQPVSAAVIEAEADVLGITPHALVKDLRAGQKVGDLARHRGITEEQFETKLMADPRPRLEALVDRGVITRDQADRLLDRISKGHIPFWNGIDKRKK
jgi:hypothetical protein